METDTIDTDSAQAPSGRGGTLALVAAAVFVAVGVAIVVGVVLLGGSKPETLEIVIPEGTFGRIKAGEAVEVVPRSIDLKVGDTLVIRNQDQAAYDVGPFNISPGATYTQTFRRPQKLEGQCNLHPEGAVTINVRA